MADKFQSFVMKPLTGVLDNRSSIDEMAPGSFRWKLNWGINTDGKLARAKGFAKPYNTPCPYKNPDFHNQHVATVDLREPVTLLFPSVANDGVRRLFGATKSRIMSLDEQGGDWPIFPYSYGVDGNPSLTQTRFNAAELQNKIFFTNDFDLVQYHELGTATIQPIPELATAGEIGASAITKARRVISWNGLMFLLNIEEGGIRYASRIRWSDLNDGLIWKPDVGTVLSDFHDLDYGETILNALPLGGALYVFTDKSIWRCIANIDLQAITMDLSCTKIYTEPRNQSKCLAYANTLISDGNSFYYMGRDAIYNFVPGYTPEPERVEWLHKSTGIIFNKPDTVIDNHACASPIIEYFPQIDELHISWPTYQKIATGQNQIGGEIDCDAYTIGPPEVGSGINNNTLVANLRYKSADFREYGSTAMVNFRSDILEAGDCNQEILRLMASGRDFCIKQLDVGNTREFYDPVLDTYAFEGYYSILRFIFPYEKFDAEKLMKSFLVEHTEDSPNDEAVFRLRLGVSDSALDPNVVANGKCGVLWHQLRDQPIRCRNNYTPAEYVAKNIRPIDPVEWHFYWRGKFLAAELSICNADGTPAVSGGLSISRFETTAKLA